MSKYTFDSFYRYVQKVGFVKAKEYVEKNPRFQEAFEEIQKLSGKKEYA